MAEVRVISRTQRIIVDSPSCVSIVNAGPIGPPGVQGLQGIPGNAGPPGESSGIKRWYGNGPPDVVVGAAPNDEYVDLDTGDLYILV